MYQQNHQKLQVANEINVKASTDTSSCYGVKKCAEVVYNAAKMKKGKGLTVLKEKMKVLDPEQNKIYKFQGYSTKKCVALLRSTKKHYYDNLDEKDVTDNKLLWKNVKPYLSDRSVKSDQIHFNENEELKKSQSETAEVLNNFFSNILKKLKIPKYENLDSKY